MPKIDEEILDAVGGDSEDKGIKAVKEIQKEEEKEQAAKDAIALEELTAARNKKEIYYRSILAEARLRAIEFTPPRGFDWIFKISDKGLALYLKDTQGNQYGYGMKILGEPIHDARGIDALITKGLDYMDILASKTSKNGHSKQG